MFLHRESDETTASLTGSSSGSSNEITPDNSDRTSGGSLSSGEVQQKVVNITNLRTYDNANRNSKQQRHYEQHHQEEEDVVEQHQQQQARGTIQVRKMQWTDPKNGQMGSYTGQVNTHFIPHGYGVMEYHDPSVLVKEGKWKDGRYRKSNNGSSRKGEDGGVGRSSSRSASRSRSKSRDVGHRSSTTTRARSSSRRPTEQVVVVGGGGGTS
ncbi:hypothetical protein ACHAWU_005627 [Discostella pseudostelligera]|uniref:Uncharacterized protein n=1 Tax=Discostella pseudostelligera TaxID=259834 RepID=A0ABD3LWJ0_9STRA